MARTLTAAAFACALATGPALAQEAGDADEVVARVDGAAITRGDVDLAMEALSGQLGDAPEDRQRAVVTDLLIDMNVIANAARERGFDETADFERQMRYLTLQTLREMYFGKVIEPEITEASLRERYEREIGQIPPQPQVRARHILVESKEEAEALIEEIAAGADFAALAEEHSTDPGSGPEGGDLGFFGRGQMVAPFEAAAFSLEPGEVTPEPVESRFGFHVIKVEETRERPLPAFEDVEDQLRQIVLREAFVEAVDRLKADATVERLAGAPSTPAPAPETDGAAGTGGGDAQ